MNEGSRLLGVFFEPRRTFADIAERPRWIVPLLAALLFGAAFLYVFNTKVGWQTYLHRITDNNPRMLQLAEDQRQRIFDTQLRIVPIFSYVSVFVIVPLTFLLAAAISMGIIQGLLGVPIRFKQAFAAFCYASLPRALYGVLAIVVILVSPHREDVDPQNAFLSNASALMDPQTSSKFLYTLASGLDFFVLWVMILAAMGLKAAGGKKLSFGGAFFAVALPYAVWIFIRSGLAAAGLMG